MAKIVTIGELLWDMLPDGAHVGGAPANVAFHLAQAGHRASLASAVGDDDLGRRALRLTAEGGVDTSLIALDAAYPTGVVQVALDAGGVPTFDIQRDVAWDHIPWSEALATAVETASAVVFGTLAQRQARSRETIRAAVARAGHAPRVLDLNLRPPFFDAATVRTSLELASILKLSQDEASELPALLGVPASADALFRIAEAFDLQRVYITKGADGCDIIDGDRRTCRPAPQVEVVDTVGAGDAFTAAMVDGELRGLDVATIAEHAVQAGAFVASRPGATPAWTAELRAKLR